MITDVVSFDGHAFAGSYEVDFVSGTRPRLPPAQVATLQRIGAWPVIVALVRNPDTRVLLIKITDLDNVDALRTQLFRWFDPEDETPKVLVGENHAGVEMYGYALCQELRLFSTPRHQQVFVATLVVDGDVRWRSTSTTSDVRNITATATEWEIVNAGEDEVYPVYKIKPTTGKTGGYAYRCWVPVVWRSENAGSDYPLLATMDTATPVGASKMQADGDDLRVLVDGLQVDRWLDDMNGASTKIWFNASFHRAPSLTLKTQIAAAGAISSIEFNEETEVALLPVSGILLIDDEAFVYTARNLVDATVTGITREAKGTSAALHTVDDTVHWIQHDVTILYGNAAATAPSVDDDYKPMFELDLSDGDTWVYESFGDGNNKRTGRWVNASGSITVGGSGGRYTAYRRDLADPYTAIGAWRTTGGAFFYGWSLIHPCGIVNAAWADGQARAVDKDSFTFRLRYWLRGASWWSTQLNWMGVYDPLAADNTWEAWSEAAAVADWDPAEEILLCSYGSSYLGDFEAGTVTVSLNASEVPVVSVNAEQGNYELSCTLINEETGEEITLEFVMDLDTELEIDTDARTVTWLADDSGQFQAQSLSSVRRHWLRLLPGSNIVQFHDTGTGNVTLTTTWEMRYY